MFLQIFIPIVVYTICTVLFCVAVHFAHVALKNSRLKHAIKKQAKAESKLEKQQQQKAILKNGYNTDSTKLTYAKKINALHTADNYSTLYTSKKSPYKTLKAFHDKLVHKVDTQDSTPRTKKKLSKTAKKIELLKQTGLKSEALKPDWVREISNDKVDKRTYIQCFDENLANDFEVFTQNNYATDNEFPYVFQVEYKNQNFAPLIVSSPDENIIKKGINLICEKINNQLQNGEVQTNIFPLTVKFAHIKNKNNKIATIRNITELEAFVKNIQTQTTEISL